jgi:hypothetical protein
MAVEADGALEFAQGALAFGERVGLTEEVQSLRVGLAKAAASEQTIKRINLVWAACCSATARPGFNLTTIVQLVRACERILDRAS